MRWISHPSHRSPRVPPTNDVFHAWILSLPWVVERAPVHEALGVRVFAVACEPLGIRQLWLVTGKMGSYRVAIVVPDQFAQSYEDSGLGRALAPMPSEHKLFALYDDVSEIDVERVVLEAYGIALSA
jgi:hypothetical protein